MTFAEADDHFDGELSVQMGKRSVWDSTADTVLVIDGDLKLDDDLTHQKPWSACNTLIAVRGNLTVAGRIELYDMWAVGYCCPDLYVRGETRAQAIVGWPLEPENAVIDDWRPGRIRLVGAVHVGLVCLRESFEDFFNTDTIDVPFAFRNGPRRNNWIDNCVQVDLQHCYTQDLFVSEVRHERSVDASKILDRLVNAQAIIRFVPEAKKLLRAEWR